MADNLRKIGLAAIIARIEALETGINALTPGASGAEALASAAESQAREMSRLSHHVVAVSSTATDGASLDNLANRCWSMAKRARSHITL